MLGTESTEKTATVETATVPDPKETLKDATTKTAIEKYLKKETIENLKFIVSFFPEDLVKKIESALDGYPKVKEAFSFFLEGSNDATTAPSATPTTTTATTPTTTAADTDTVTTVKQPEIKVKKLADIPMIEKYKQYERLRNLIAGGEADSKDLYNSYNKGMANDSKNKENIDFSQKTLKEVINMQETNKIFAVGLYQFAAPNNKSVLREAMNSLHLPENEKFTPKLQDKIFVEYFLWKHPTVGKFLRTGKDINGAINGLAGRWAAIKKTNGEGRYDNIAGNKATISHKDTKKVLITLRDELKKKGTL